MGASPDTDNLSILQGIVSYHPGDTLPSPWDTTHDLGSVIRATMALDGVETRKHLSRRTGVRSVDLEVITQKGATITLVMEEYTAKNLQLAMAGGTITGTSPKLFFALDNPNQKGWIKIVGTNTVGAQVSLVAKVSVVPTGEFNFISENDDFDNFTAAFTVLADGAGKYGEFSIVEAA